MRNFPKKYLVVRKLYVNLHRKARSSVGGRLNLTLLEETSGQLYGQSRKDVFNTLPVCIIKSRKFESSYSGDATEASAWVNIYILPRPVSLYILIRCKSPLGGVRLGVYVLGVLGRIGYA